MRRMLFPQLGKSKDFLFRAERRIHNTFLGVMVLVRVENLEKSEKARRRLHFSAHKPECFRGERSR